MPDYQRNYDKVVKYPIRNVLGIVSLMADSVF